MRGLHTRAASHMAPVGLLSKPAQAPANVCRLASETDSNQISKAHKLLQMLLPVCNAYIV